MEGCVVGEISDWCAPYFEDAERGDGGWDEEEKEEEIVRHGLRLDAEEIT